MTSSPRLCTRLSYDDFLTFDGPTGVSVAPDDTRRNFFRHVGLSEHNPRHLRLYHRMKQEARVGMERLFSSRASLQPHLVNDDTVLPPYSPTQMTEVAFQQQVERIHRGASRSTRGIYDLFDAGHGQNWVIRWVLWRVIQVEARRETRAASSVAESDVSMLSTCSTVTDYPSIKTEQASPPYSSPVNVWFTTALSPRNDSDSDDLYEAERKIIKLDPASSSDRKGFWDSVMGGLDTT